MPVPWVAVEIEPASDCRSMSPRFSSARPRWSSRRFRSASTIPASTLTSPLGRSTSRIRLSIVRSSIVPSVSAMPVNEWPEPATLIRRSASFASISAAIRPSRVRGRAIRNGRQRCSPDQFLQRLRTSSAMAANPR